MKRLILPLLLLTLLLTACSRPAPTQPSQPSGFSPEVVEQLLACGAFSEPIDPLTPDIAWGLYHLSAAGLAREQMTDAVVYLSSGATCENASLLTFTDEATAEIALGALEEYCADQIVSNRDYRPLEIPKLEQAQLIHRGNTLLLLIANDYTPALDLLDL